MSELNRVTLLWYYIEGYEWSLHSFLPIIMEAVLKKDHLSQTTQSKHAKLLHPKSIKLQRIMTETYPLVGVSWSLISSSLSPLHCAARTQIAETGNSESTVSALNLVVVTIIMYTYYINCISTNLSIPAVNPERETGGGHPEWYLLQTGEEHNTRTYIHTCTYKDSN